MTTGRINQVAFPNDAGSARRATAPGGRRLEMGARRSYASALNARHGQTEAAGLLPSWCAASERSSVPPWAGAGASADAHDAEHGRRFGVRPATPVEGRCKEECYVGTRQCRRQWVCNTGNRYGGPRRRRRSGRD